MTQLPSDPTNAAAVSSSRLAYRLNAGLRDARADEPTPLAKAHALLRGRYQIAVVLSVVLATLLSVGVYFAITPVYESVATIRINDRSDAILDPSNRETLGGYFNEFLNSQMRMISSPRIIQLAMQSPEWRRTDRFTGGVQAEEQFTQQIMVTRPQGTADVQIRFRDESEAVAKAGADALVNAYLRVYREGVGQRQNQKLQILTDRSTALANRLSTIREEIVQIAREYGTVDLGQAYQQAVARKAEFENRLREVNLQLRQLGVKVDETQLPSVDLSAYSPAQLAQMDRSLGRMLEEEARLARQIEQLKVSLGRYHRTVMEAQRSLDVLRGEIEERIESIRANPVVALSGRRGMAGTGEADATDVALLQQRAADLAELIEEQSAQVMEVGEQKLAVERLQADAQRIQEDLVNTRQRIETLTVEQAGNRLVELISEGTQPVTPVNQKMRVQLAALGAVGGVALGFGLVLFFGLFDGRLRNYNDAHTLVGDLPMLGMLPTLPDDLADPEQARLAAYSVHHIRTMLQIAGDAEGHKVFTITSPVSGSGKTSLALALALSFASSRARTLIIDGDLDSGAVSSRLEAIARKRLGQILLSQGRITDEQLNAAVRDAREQGIRVGEALVNRGVVAADEVDRALNIQVDTRVGIMDALSGDPVENCVVETGIANLWILPVGNATSEDSGRIAPGPLRRVLSQARSMFDIVLIDGGPMPGSVAAAMCASASDGTVLIVSRGDRGVQLRNTEHLLKSLHASVAGVVFNRADARDIERSSALTSYNLSGGAFSDDASYEPGSLDPTAKRFGPMARAIVSRQGGVERSVPVGSIASEHSSEPGSESSGASEGTDPHRG